MLSTPLYMKAECERLRAEKRTEWKRVVELQVSLHESVLPFVLFALLTVNLHYSIRGN